MIKPHDEFDGTDLSRKFGKLRLRDPTHVTHGSEQEIWWICDCGREVLKRVANVTKGQTKSCGQCNEISAEKMASCRFGKLRMKEPAAVTSGSAKKVTWVCDCGREKDIMILSVVNGATSSCTKCDHLSMEEMASRKFGRLRMKEPIEINPWSHGKIWWVCDCGREKKISIRYVVQGTTKTCGRCNEIPVEEMASRKFGRLRMKEPETILANSNKKTWWICDCGRETFTKTFLVTSGRTASCGQCADTLRRIWERNRDAIRALRTPIWPVQIPEGCPVPLDPPITKTSEPFRASCPLCGGEYGPRWSGIRLGVSLSCGCSSSRVSAGQRQIADFISELGVDADTEFKIGKLSYDVWVPSHNLVIEFNGLKWHSRNGAKEQDVDKWRNAVDAGFDFMMIFEDEWRLSRPKFESLIRNRLGLGSAKSLRPRQCTIGSTNGTQANELYVDHHYMGRVSAPVHVGASFDGKLIACASFKRPTRQSSHDWELARMVSHSDFRIHGIWSKLMKQFVKKRSPQSVVTFSDNRIFDGAVYAKMGFVHDGDVRPDHYWVKANRRHHKSRLRKTEEEKLTGKTEIQLREAQGYRRIWDLGKKRWLWKA